MKSCKKIIKPRLKAQFVSTPLKYYVFIIFTSLLLLLLYLKNISHPYAAIALNLFYGITGSLLVSFIIDIGSTRARKLQDATAWETIKSKFENKFGTLVSAYSSETIIGYTGNGTIIEKSKKLFSDTKPLYPSLFFFHSRMIISAYMSIRNSAYDMLSFAQTHPEYKDKASKILEVIKSIDDIERSYEYYLGVSVPAGFFDSSNIYNCISSFNNKLKDFDRTISEQYLENNKQSK